MLPGRQLRMIFRQVQVKLITSRKKAMPNQAPTSGKKSVGGSSSAGGSERYSGPGLYGLVRNPG
jgi:hypothetical protein